MLPPCAVAASFVPFAEEVIPYQFFAAPVVVTSVQFAPLLLEVQMVPCGCVLSPYTTAASFVPSVEEVISSHCFVALTEVSSVQVIPALLEGRPYVAIRYSRRQLCAGSRKCAVVCIQLMCVSCVLPHIIIFQ